MAITAIVLNYTRHNSCRVLFSEKQDAKDLGMATDNELGLLLAWKEYRVLLNRIDASTAPVIEWPTAPAQKAI